MTTEEIYMDVRTILNESNILYFCHINNKEFHTYSSGENIKTIVEIVDTNQEDVYLKFYDQNNKNKFRILQLTVHDNKLKLYDN